MSSLPKYQRRIAAHTTAKGSIVSACPVEEYLNEDLYGSASAVLTIMGQWQVPCQDLEF